MFPDDHRSMKYGSRAGDAGHGPKGFGVTRRSLPEHSRVPNAVTSGPRTEALPFYTYFYHLRFSRPAFCRFSLCISDKLRVLDEGRSVRQCRISGDQGLVFSVSDQPVWRYSFLPFPAFRTADDGLQIG